MMGIICLAGAVCGRYGSVVGQHGASLQAKPPLVISIGGDLDLEANLAQGDGMEDLEQRRQQYIRSSGLGEAILPPVRVGDCELSLHRQVVSDPTYDIAQQQQDEDFSVSWRGFPEEGELADAMKQELSDRLRTVLTTSPAIGSVSAVSVCPDGSVSQGGLVEEAMGGTSSESGAAIHGPLPAGAVSVEVMVGEETIPVHVGQGLFLAAVPPGAEVTIIFKGPQSEIIEEHHIEAGWL